MNILITMQEKACQGREAFTKWLDDDCKATCEIVKNNMFSPKGREALKKLQKKLREMK